jgi:hypothetical protein
LSFAISLKLFVNELVLMEIFDVLFVLPDDDDPDVVELLAAPLPQAANRTPEPTNIATLSGRLRILDFLPNVSIHLEVTEKTPHPLQVPESGRGAIPRAG